MIRAIFLASGRSGRFDGGNKLTYEVEGVPMAERVFRALPEDIPGFVVTGWSEVAALAHNHNNLTVIDNPDGADNVAVTIRLGVEALSPDTEGVLFFVCDQPWLTKTSVRRLTDAFSRDPSKIYVLATENRSGNPCLFPRAYLPELAALPFDKGGKTVIRRHPEAVRYVKAAAPRELEDIDTRP